MTRIRKHLSFSNDKEKMIDFLELTKDEFLQSYSYLTEKEYEETKKDVLNQLANQDLVVLLNAFLDNYCDLRGVSDTVELLESMGATKEQVTRMDFSKETIEAVYGND